MAENDVSMKIVDAAAIVHIWGGGPRVVVSTAAFHARVRGSVPGLGGLKETKMFLPHPRVKVSIVGSLRDREVACSASDRQGSNFESCVWRTVSSQSSHHPQEVLLAQFSLYVHKSGLKPDSFHFCPYMVRTIKVANFQQYVKCHSSTFVQSMKSESIIIRFDLIWDSYPDQSLTCLTQEKGGCRTKVQGSTPIPGD